jgi:hypothetical protein
VNEKDLWIEIFHSDSSRNLKSRFGSGERNLNDPKSRRIGGVGTPSFASSGIRASSCLYISGKRRKEEKEDRVTEDFVGDCL